MGAHGHPSDVYTGELQTLGEGDALWFPEPHTSGEIQIGDVGYIAEGAFIRLFNVISPEEFPVPDSELPEGFEPLQAPRVRHMDVRERALAPGHHNSKSVVCTQVKASASMSAGAGLSGATTWEYMCMKEKGAVLILKNFATKQVALAHRLFEQYAGKHYVSWCKYAEDLSVVKLVLIYGTMKTTADWTATTFTTTGGKFTASLGGGLPGAGGVSTLISRQNSVHGPVVNRVGLYAHDQRPNDAKYDQCVFIKSCHIKHRHRHSLFNFFLRAGAGPDQLPDQRDANSGQGGPAISANDSQEDVEMGDDMRQHRHYGPMDSVLDYILEFSEAQVAVCCEDDLEYRLLGLNRPDDTSRWLRENQPRIDVDGDGVGTLSLEEAISRRRSHLITFGVTSSSDASFPEGEQPDGVYDDGADELPHISTLGHGTVILGSRLSPPIEWPHLSFKEKESEGGSTSSMALSPNGKIVATTCEDTTILLWDVLKARAVRRLEGHSDTVWTVAFSPDSTRLASGSGDTTASVWDIETTELLFTFIGHEADVWSVVYSPDATKIATGSTDCTVKVWSAFSGEMLHSLEDHSAHVMLTAFSPNGIFLASCADAIAIIWNVETGEKVSELRGHGGAIWCMRFSHAGDRLITGSEDQSGRVWDAQTGDELVTLREHTSPVWSVSFSPDDQEVATGSYDCVIATCDSFSGERHNIFFNERGPSPIDTIAYSNSGEFLVSGSADGNVRLWDAKNGDFVAEYRGHADKVKSVMFTPDDSDIISSSEDGTVKGWNVHDVIRLY